MAFYWYNFMPLSRGSAATGIYLHFSSVFSSFSVTVTSPLVEKHSSHQSALTLSMIPSYEKNSLISILLSISCQLTMSMTSVYQTSSLNFTTQIHTHHTRHTDTHKSPHTHTLTYVCGLVCVCVWRVSLLLFASCHADCVYDLWLRDKQRDLSLSLLRKLYTQGMQSSSKCLD